MKAWLCPFSIAAYSIKLVARHTASNVSAVVASEKNRSSTFRSRKIPRKQYNSTPNVSAYWYGGEKPSGG